MINQMIDECPIRLFSPRNVVQKNEMYSIRHREKKIRDHWDALITLLDDKISFENNERGGYQLTACISSVTKNDD